MNARRRLPGTPKPMHVWSGADGVPISGDAWGPVGGPVVILQHGGGQTRHAWKNTGEILGKAGYHVVAFDARGHGDSGWSTEGHYGVDYSIQDLRCVQRALGANRPILVGASMGGGTSLIAVGEGHLDAAALVLVDTAPHIEPEGVQQIQDFMDQNPQGFSNLEEVATAIANYQPHRKRPRKLDGLAKNVRLGDDGRLYWHWDPAWRRNRVSWDSYRARLHECGNRIRLSTLLVRGGLSNVLSEAGAQRFLQQCPHAEYVNVENAAHMVAGDRNDIFTNAVADFLGRVAPISTMTTGGPRRMS